jgi:hypothetical protein
MLERQEGIDLKFSSNVRKQGGREAYLMSFDK